MAKDLTLGRGKVVAALDVSIFTALGLLFFSYKYLDDLARARTGTFLRRLIEEMTAAYGVALLLPFLVMFARRYRLQSQNWLRRLPLHLLALVIFSLAHTTLNGLSRYLLFPLAGLGSYDYGILSIRYLMEFSSDAIIYSLSVAFVYLFDDYRAARERELKMAQLETSLTQAQLQALRVQLQPHFLFNALNTISSIIYEDVQAADQMIVRLSDLLRLTLRNSQSQEVKLSEELEFLNLYLEIMRARFEERLVINFDVESGIQDALVPQLILQPLVENSIRYAADPRSGVVTIGVCAKRENGALLLEVNDKGTGIVKDQQAVLGDGIGLSNTAARLKQLYGAAHGLTLRNSVEGGLQVKIQIPFHTVRKTNGMNGDSANVEDTRTDY